MAHTIKPEDYCTGIVSSRIPAEIQNYMADTRQVPVTQEIVDSLNAAKDPKVKIIEDIGVRITGHGDAEKSDNIPRLFILQPSQSDPAQDEAKDLKSAGIPFGSLAFWKEVQKGNVFAYPAGTANPVQLRLDTSVPGHPVFGYSKPIDPEDIPLREKPVPDPAPTRPYRFTMWLNSKFGMFKGRVNAYNQRVQAYQSYQQRRASLLDPIRQQAESRNSNTRLGSEITQTDERFKKIETAKNSSDLVDFGEPLIRELYGTKPVRRKEYTYEDLPESLKGKSRYKQDEFNLLKPVEIDFKKIPVGNSGISVEEEDYVALGMFAATQYKYIKKALDKSKDEADWMMDDLKAYEIKDPESRRADSINTMVTADIVNDKDGPRENIGSFFKDVIQPAREEAQAALGNYRKAASEKSPEKRRKLKEGIGSIIASGINNAANFTKSKAEVSYQDRLMARKAGRLIKLMEKDPELRKIAEEKGMVPEKLKSVKGLVEYDQLAREKDNAMKELKTAAAYGKPLTEQQKKDFAKKISKANTFEAIYKNAHKMNREKEGSDFKRLYDKLTDFNNMTLVPTKKNPQTGANIQLPWRECPGLKDGKIYYGNPMSKVEMALLIEKLPEPEIAVLMSNPEGQKWLDDFTQSQIDKMNINEMDAEEIDRKLQQDSESKNLINEGAASMMQFAASKKGEVKEAVGMNLQNEKKVEINPNPVPVLG